MLSPHPLLPRVVAAMQSIAPLHLADRSWDNVGTLVESPALSEKASAVGGKILLTIDLTPAVAQEAIRKNIDVIVAYHPFIFMGLKSITLRDSKQASLMQLVQKGISVYCPHSALDACKGGINDWLCDIVTAPEDVAEAGASTVPITPTENNVELGAGRLRKFTRQAVTLKDALARVKANTGLNHVRLALPEEKRDIPFEEIKLSSVAVCAGSGTSVFRGLKKEVPSLILSGEMGHHDVLGHIQKGSVVILTEHTNSERGYLKARLQQNLFTQLGSAKDIEILVSECDRDPLVAF